jgi:transcriptional regulator with XRE-family HTH domain
LDFWERLDKEIDERSNRKTAMAAAGVALNSVSTWKTRKTVPAADVLYAIARALNVTVEYLLTGTDAVDPWLREQRQLIADLKALTPEQLTMVADQVAATAARNRAAGERDHANATGSA